VADKPGRDPTSLFTEAQQREVLETVLRVVIEKLDATGHQWAMATERFQASRWTKGNFLFPTIIEVDERAVVRRKRHWFSVDEITINLSKVASVHIKTGLIWSDVLIESSGGTDPLASHGHTKGDARRIKDLIEEHQTDAVGKVSKQESVT
jgi:hypothetical protein